MGKSHRPPLVPQPHSAPTQLGAAGLTLSIVFVAVVSCTPTQPQPRLTSISPQQGYTDHATVVHITGSNLVPAYMFDLQGNQVNIKPDGFSGEVSGPRGRVRLLDMVWRSPNLLQAVLEKGLPGPAEVYNVTVVDPRGEAATLINGFISLGPDLSPPVITITEPDPARLVAAGNSVPVDFSVSDVGEGRLQSITYSVLFEGIAKANGRCEVEPLGGPTRCRFEAQVPIEAAPGQLLEIKLYASDASTNSNFTSKVIPMTLVAAPAVISRKPGQGPATGGTDILVKGQNIPPDAKVYIGGIPLEPNGGTRIDDETIVGRTPPGPQGRANIEIRSITGTSTLFGAQDFVYLQPLSLSTVDPDSAPFTGGAGIRVVGEGFTMDTVIILGDRATTGTPLIGAVEGVAQQKGQTVIEGNVPPGVGSTSVWAVDPVLGKTRWMGTFTWQPEAMQDPP
jgi:hypothetical protein